MKAPARTAGALALALSLALAGQAAAQPVGTPTVSEPPAGLEAGKGAPHPKGSYASLDALPDWGGIWFVLANRGTPNPQPVLKGAYAEKWEQWKKDLVANDGVVKRDRSNCSPPGLPRIMMLAQYPYEFIFSPGRVTINQEAWMQTRTIWTDGREHPPLEELDPTFHGHSIGRWEGDTLVVDTIGILDTLEFGTGATHSDKFRLIERISLDPTDPNLMINRMRMEDPEALAQPYEVTTRYRRDRYGQLIEFQCSENDRNPVNEAGETEYN